MRRNIFIKTMLLLLIGIIVSYIGIQFSHADEYIARNISKNNADDYSPSFYDGQIAWQSDVDGDNDIYYWNGSMTTNLSNNSADDLYPSLNNGQIAWQSNTDGNYDIQFWDGATVSNISNDTEDSYYPSLSNGQIAWQPPPQFDRYSIFLGR